MLKVSVVGEHPLKDRLLNRLLQHPEIEKTYYSPTPNSAFTESLNNCQLIITLPYTEKLLEIALQCVEKGIKLLDFSPFSP